MDSSKFLVSEKESDNARAFYSARPKGNACNVSKASEKHEDGGKKRKRNISKTCREKRERKRETKKGGRREGNTLLLETGRKP